MYILITKTESNTYLTEFFGWSSLPDATKDLHIKKASLFVQTNWICSEVDWSDSTTIPDDVKEATAYYAYASYSSNLFGSVTSEDGGTIKKKSNKVGSLADSVEYRGSSPGGAKNSTGYPDSLMKVSGCTATSSSNLLRC